MLNFIVLIISILILKLAPFTSAQGKIWSYDLIDFKNRVDIIPLTRFTATYMGVGQLKRQDTNSFGAKPCIIHYNFSILSTYLV